MCGILGVVYRDQLARADEALLAYARDTLTHRGPDEQGLWTQPGVAFAHRRLKILDLTHGQQPMTSADDQYALCYNGEIYNFAQLREKMIADAGETFQSHGDTEVLFKALNHSGATALDDLNGMFAFGHWDGAAHQLLLARDRLGQKPLYYLFDDEKLIFASELKALLEYAQQQFELDPVALDQFFAKGYVLSPRTIFKGIAKLPAGCKLELDVATRQAHVSAYWDATPVPVPDDPQQAMDELEVLLTDAVRLRLVSDVPIGCLLSGGIDSSLLTALAAKVSETPVQTFSIAFDESEALNELPYAKMVAEHCGVTLNARQVGGDDFADQLETTAAYFDEPYGNFAMFPMRRLSQLAREKMTVVLSGQGGDELTAGYPGRYNWVVQSQPAAESGNRLQFSPPVDDLVQHLNHSSFVPWPSAREHILSDSLKADVCTAATPFDDIRGPWTQFDGDCRLNRVLYTDVKTNLPDYLVCLEERMSMSCSLEARNPFLDHRVVRFLLSLPAAWKVRDGENKWILKELACRHVPRAAIDRPKKGFTPPLQLWLSQSTDQLRAIFEQTDTQTRGIYSEHWRNFLRAGQYEGNATMPVFYSLMFALWAKRYGRFVSHWPGAEEKTAAEQNLQQSVTSFLDVPAAVPAAKPAVAAASCATVIADDPCQQALLQQSQQGIATARWFTQAMRNFDDGSTVSILGDEGGWYDYLASACGLVTTESTSAQGIIVIGLQQMIETADMLANTAVVEASQVVFFVPFGGDKQQQIQTAMQQVAQQLNIVGSQAVPVSDAAAVLIARAALIGQTQQTLQQAL